MKMEVKYGLSRDAEILETALKERAMKTGDVYLIVHHVDPRTAQLGWADVAFHIEVPCRIAIPFARKHYFLVNPEWFYKEEWSWTLKVPNATFIQRYSKALKAEDGFPASQVFTWLWRGPANTVPPMKKIRQRQFVCFLGASKHKLAATQEICPLWPATAPLLKIWGSEEVITKLKPVCEGRANIKLSSEHMSNEDVLKTLSDSDFCVLPSQAEGFGYAMCDAMMTGCLPLWSDVPAYCALLDDVMGSNGQLIGSEGSEACEFVTKPRILKTRSFETALRLLLEMPMDDIFATRTRLMTAMNDRIPIFRQHATLLWNTMLRDLEKNPATPCFGAPPQVLTTVGEDKLPRVGVVTLTWNRPHWMKLAFKNILAQNYPRDRLVWCVVDDGSFDKRVDQSVTKFSEQNSDLAVEYVSLPKKTHIGGKRNRAVKRILEKFPDTAFFCMMDDDDVYFPSSVRDRVSWLASSGKGACYSSILPLYDLTTYTSSINVPPLTLSPAKRCSEASMAFTTEFFKGREFPSTISMAEGEAFLAGREEETVEIPPQGVIVSLLHSQNTSSRGFTGEKDNKDKQNGCHYGFSDEFFLFLHGLGQTSVTEAAAAAASAAEAKAKAQWLEKQKAEQELKNSSEQPVPSVEGSVAEKPVSEAPADSSQPAS
jgi:glycosyltransferase involved in cell wall biosynthesis